MNTSIVTDANKDALAVVDVYSQKSNSTPLNRIKQLTPNIENTFSAIKNNSILAEIKKIKDAPSLVDRITTVDALYSRLSELQAGLRGSLTKLDNSSIQELIAVLGGDPNSKLAKVVMDGKSFYNLKTKDTNAFVKLVAGVLGDTNILKFFDLEAEGALLGQLVGMAMELGLGDVVDKLIDKVSDEKIKKKLLEDNLLTAVLSSDIKTVIKIVNELGVAKCLLKQPTIVYDLISYYRIDRRVEGNASGELIPNNINITDLRNEIETLLARFNPEWDLDTVVLNNVPTKQPSFLNTSNASNDFRLLYPSKMLPGADVPLTNPDDEAKRKQYNRRSLLMMNSKLLRKTDVYTLARRQYKGVPLMNG